MRGGRPRDGFIGKTGELTLTLVPNEQAAPRQLVRSRYQGKMPQIEYVVLDNALRKQAAELGADAVVITQAQGLMFGSLQGVNAAGKAIRWTR